MAHALIRHCTLPRLIRSFQQRLVDLSTGEVNWFEGCGLGNYDIRGAIAAGLEQNKADADMV